MEPKPSQRRDKPPEPRWWSRLSTLLPVLTSSEQVTVYNQIRHDARANVDFFAMILMSSSMAFFGLLQNSAAVIIGAMLVAPLMSPMLAIGHGIAMGNAQLYKRSAYSTLQGVSSVVAISALLTLLIPDFRLILPQGEIMARTHPNLIDQCIALVSGAAAAYALSRKGVAAAMPGVAIAAALVPPLCVTGYGLGSARWEIAIGSLLLFLTNLAAIIFASSLMFIALGFHPTHVDRYKNVRRGITIAVFGMLLVTVPLVFTTHSGVQHLRTERIIHRALRDIVPAQLGEIDQTSVTFDKGKVLIEFTTYRYRLETSRKQSEKMEEDVLQKLHHRLSRELNRPFEIKILVVNSSIKMSSYSAD